MILYRRARSSRRKRHALIGAEVLKVRTDGGGSGLGSVIRRKVAHGPGKITRAAAAVISTPQIHNGMITAKQGRTMFASNVRAPEIITEDVTTELAQIEDLFVVSRNTAYTFRNKPTDTKQIGRGLGVRYVLDGSVRWVGNHVRINVQLINAETDAHLWAQRFDTDNTDLFALQNEVTIQIAAALNELFAADTGAADLRMARKQLTCFSPSTA
jgi:TolB-like protein